MSVAAILARADALGVQVRAVGDDLKARWSAAAPPPPDLIAALKANKLAILAAMSALPDAGEWRDYFEERAAIREHDGGMSRADAEAAALADLATRWRAEDPLPASPQSACAHCGAPVATAEAMPVLAAGGHAWLHDRCWAPMDAARQAAALAAVRELLRNSEEPG